MFKLHLRMLLINILSVRACVCVLTQQRALAADVSDPHAGSRAGQFAQLMVDRHHGVSPQTWNTRHNSSLTHEATTNRNMSSGIKTQSMISSPDRTEIIVYQAPYDQSLRGGTNFWCCLISPI